jgi:serine/threonine protein kinase
MQTQELTQIRSLGEGGFGTTALVERDSKRYVLKRLKQSAIADHGQTAIDLFIKESEYLKVLGDHAQIPALIDSGVDEEGPWLLQEYIPGDNLETILSQQLRFSEAEIIQLLKSILPVLKSIHHAGAIHRDIKPANIIFSGDRYYLVDFGASKQVSETVLAKTGTMIGTAQYAAPEQVLGRAAFASDIYSLGVTCIHLLTGLPPMELIDRMEAGRWCWRDFLPKERSVSEGLGLILDKMLEYGVHRRYNSADEVLEAIANIDRRTISRQRLVRIGKIRRNRIVLNWVFTTGVSVLAVATIACVVWGLLSFGSWLFSLESIISLPSSPPDLGKSQSPENMVMAIGKLFPFVAWIIGLAFMSAIFWAGMEIIMNQQPPALIIKPVIALFSAVGIAWLIIRLLFS